jgi:hypothetical protein
LPPERGSNDEIEVMVAVQIHHGHMQAARDLGVYIERATLMPAELNVNAIKAWPSRRTLRLRNDGINAVVSVEVSESCGTVERVRR